MLRVALATSRDVSRRGLTVTAVLEGKHQKHHDIRFKELRKYKLMPITMPDLDERRRLEKSAKMRDNFVDQIKKTKDHFRERQIGDLMPSAHDIITKSEGPITLACTNAIMEPYVIPDEGRKSIVDKVKSVPDKASDAKQRRAHKKVIQEYDETFRPEDFAIDAQDIYFNALHRLQDMKKYKDELHELLTEIAYPRMTMGLDKKTFRWRFVEQIEPPEIVRFRTADLMHQGDKFGQVTVRLHTRQLLALYDRFGRLMYGSEAVPRDCLEYVVFEKYLSVSEESSRWRVHGQIRSAKTQEPVVRTLRRPDIPSLTESQQSSAEEG